VAENSKIEWTDHTFNPWLGCTKISPACDHCYAESWAKRTGQAGLWAGERRRTSAANWHMPVKWDRFARRDGVRRRVFCASLADWLDNRVPEAWRADLAALIADTPNLDWLLLTKRPENLARLAPWRENDVPANVWLGITAEDQAHFDRRWRRLRDWRACVRFVSYEPALGPLSMPHTDKPDWVICGGESGASARVMDPAWARALRDECAAEGIAFFMKQMTGKTPIPDDLMVRQDPQAVRQ
jgi:protein gp37